MPQTTRYIAIYVSYRKTIDGIMGLVVACMLLINVGKIYSIVIAYTRKMPMIVHCQR